MLQVVSFKPVRSVQTVKERRPWFCSEVKGKEEIRSPPTTTDSAGRTCMMGELIRTLGGEETAGNPNFSSSNTAKPDMCIMLFALSKWGQNQESFV